MVDTVPDRMPRREHYGQERLTTVDLLDSHYRKVKAGEQPMLTSQERRVLGYGLPSWQRPSVWSDEQNSRFIQSMWAGRPLGTWMVNVVDADAPHPLEGLILDGQQRLRAIERYFNDEVAVPDVNGVSTRWSDLNAKEQRRFKSIIFPHVEVRLTDELALQKIYDAHNFGGVAHQAHERAVGQPLDSQVAPALEAPPAEVKARSRRNSLR